MEIPKEAYPLCWPSGWKRTPYRKEARFGNCGIASYRDAVMDQLLLLGASRVIISSNLRLRLDGLPIGAQANPSDPGIAIYFQFRGKPRVLACDRWQKAEHNLWAIAKHIEALRGQERWGVGSLEQAFAGYTALPERGELRSWWTVLGVAESATLEEIKYAYRNAAKVLHPDAGGTNAAMAELNEAYRKATAGKQ
jgi:hypothetical protein